MKFSHCTNCEKDTGHKRALGWGTFFAVILTAGGWFFVIPFYPIRCIACGKGEISLPAALLAVIIFIGFVSALTGM
jgi:hypothetical protein